MKDLMYKNEFKEEHFLIIEGIVEECNNVDVIIETTSKGKYNLQMITNVFGCNFETNCDPCIDIDSILSWEVRDSKKSINNNTKDKRMDKKTDKIEQYNTNQLTKILFKKVTDDVVAIHEVPENHIDDISDVKEMDKCILIDIKSLKFICEKFGGKANK